MAINGFSFGLDDGAGAGIAHGGEQVSAERFHRAEGEEVFFVEVGGDDEQAFGVELVEGVIEERGPELGAVPEVLMPKKGQMGGTGDFFEEGEFGGVEVEEVGTELGGVLILSRPARGGFIEFGGTNVDAGELGISERGGEEVGEEACLVGTPTGEVEDVALGRKLGVEVRDCVRL